MRTSDWEHIKPGWHELVIVLNEVDRQAQRIEIVDWILTNIQKPDRHCLYTWEYAEFRILLHILVQKIICARMQNINQVSKQYTTEIAGIIKKILLL